METPASALPPMSRLCSAFLRNCLIVHSSKVLQLQQSPTTSEKMETDLAEATSLVETAMVGTKEANELDRVLKTKFDWLTA